MQASRRSQLLSKGIYIPTGTQCANLQHEEPQTASQTSDRTPTPIFRPNEFRLLDLPVELQRLVIYHYFGGPYDITLENERLTMLRSRFHVLGMPRSELCRVSKHIHSHAAPMRPALFTGRLILNSVFILVPLRRQDRFQWLRDHTRILHFSDSSMHPERWARYFDGLAALQKLEIAFPWPIKLEDLDEKGLAVKDLISGRGDAMLVGALDAFRLTLVGQLREGRLSVEIRQKYELGKDKENGILVRVCPI